LARPAPGAPSEAELNASRQNAEASRTDREQYAAQCGSLNAELGVKRQACESEYIKINDKIGISRLADEMGFKDFAKRPFQPDTATEYISRIGVEISDEVTVLRSKLEAEQNAKVRAIECDGETAAAFESLKENERLRNEAAAEISEVSGRLASLEGEGEALRRSLTYADGQKAEDARKKAESDLSALRALHEKAAGERENAKRERDAALAVLSERTARKAPCEETLRESHKRYLDAMNAGGFPDEPAYRGSLLGEEDILAIENELESYERNMEYAGREAGRLATETAELEYSDLAALTAQAEGIGEAAAEIDGRLAALRGEYEANAAALRELSDSDAKIADKEKKWISAKSVSDTANGALTGKAKITFETWLHAMYFTRILRAANRRFAFMTADRYELMRRAEAGDLRAQTGLDLDVHDCYTGRRRDVRSLSGGESFKASLALAMGLSEVVQATAGGIKLDAMFIDEGFGTLDSDSLDAAITTLQEIAGRDRIVGVISHVGELAARIDRQIRVTRSRSGSKAEVVLT
jgi:exonuclease SbcC